MSQLDDFDPNTAPDPWATYCPRRRNGATFKTHTQRAHAIAAADRHGEFILYRHDGTGWVEVARRDVAKAPTACTHCGMPGKPVQWKRLYGRADTDTQRLYGVFLRNSHTRKLEEPLRIVWVCGECKKHVA